MSLTNHRLLHPLNLAGVATVFAIGLSLRWVPPADAVLAWSLLLGFVVVFVGHCLVAPRHPRLGHGFLLVQPVLALTLVWLTWQIGTAQILLVIWTAVIAATWPPRITLAAVLAADIVVYLVLRERGHQAPLTVTMLYAGFQAFAALCAHYARSAESTRDQLSLVNADLLATRALLADAARDAERLRVARELHDVAGHTLTALRLNLRALLAEAPSPQLALAEKLSADLLGEIRTVVHALRDARGLDIDTALRALAAPFPRPALRLQVDDDVAIGEPALADAVLRTVQEALTNAARHGQAGHIDVHLARDGECLRLRIEDDGQARLPLREGHGLTGMRERIDALGGELHIGRGSAGGVRIDAALPA